MNCFTYITEIYKINLACLLFVALLIKYSEGIRTKGYRHTSFVAQEKIWDVQVFRKINKLFKIDIYNF